MSAIEVATSVQDYVSQKLDMLMKMMSDRSGKFKGLPSQVKATEDHQREVEASPTSSPSTYFRVRRARCQGSPNLDPDMVKEVHHHMATRMRQLLTYSGATSEENLTSKEEVQPVPRCRKQLKSEVHWTGAATVVKKIIWPHEVVYTQLGSLPYIRISPYLCCSVKAT